MANVILYLVSFVICINYRSRKLCFCLLLVVIT